MESLTFLFDYLIHLDKHLAELIQIFGSFSYLILAAIIFGETGLVVTPFLPGDSLLFVIGALSAMGAMDIKLIMLVLIVAGILGNTVNYSIGKFVGPKIFHKENVKFLNKEYLAKAHEFYEKYGGVAIILARFMPIIRTFAPFVAGIGKMNYAKFLLYNVIGSVLWIVLFLMGGYFIGNNPIIKKNFSLVILIIILISFTPAVFTYLKEKNKKGPKE